VRAARPVAGAVYAPNLGRLWFAGAMARACDAAPGSPLPPASQWLALRSRAAPQGGLVALASRSRGDAAAEDFLARLPIAERRPAGSSLKFCLIAEGLADIYPRFDRTMEWDSAAGDAILRAAGGVVLTPDGDPLRYGKAADGYANGPFVAWGDPAAAARHMATKR
jgi:3'(2'), 5'-bisphosphate nucleotidase